VCLDGARTASEPEIMKREIGYSALAAADCIVIWIDHEQARFCHVDPNALVTRPPRSIERDPARSTVEAKDHPEATKRFFAEVSRALGDTARILILGPSAAKHEFLRYLQRHAPSVELRIVGVETVERPTDVELVRLAHKHFADK
jgi:stalled ribosome rescue protein Dom34